MYKSKKTFTLLLSIIICELVLCEDKRLSEIMSESLVEKGIEDFSFCGDLTFASSIVNQEICNDMDDVSGVSTGNIYAKYLRTYECADFGAEVGAKANSCIIKQGAAIINSAYIFLENSVGKFKVGYTGSAASDFVIDGGNVLVGYGGFSSGDFDAFYNRSSGTIVGTGYRYDDSKSLKLVWLSPQISGISCGMSFAFDSRLANLFNTKHANKEDSTLNEKESFASEPAYSRNVVSFGIAYEYGLENDFYVKASCATLIGQGKSGACRDVHNLMAYNIGFLIGYDDFKLSFGYTDNRKSLLAKEYAQVEVCAYDPNRSYNIHDPDVGIRHGADSGKLYTIGASYKFDKLAVSVGYLYGVSKFSSYEKAISNIVTTACEYSLNRSISSYIEYSNIITKTCERALSYEAACKYTSATPNNKAHMVMIGLKVNI